MTPPSWEPPPEEDEEQEGQAPSSQRSRRKPSLRYRLLRGISDLLIPLGFRRKTVAGRFPYQKRFEPRAEEPDAQGGLTWAAARPLALAAVAFAVLAALALVIFGLLPHRRDVGSQKTAAIMALQAIRRFEGGDLAATRTFAALVRVVKPPGHAAAYLNGFLRAAAPDLAFPTGALGRLSRTDEVVARAGERHGRHDARGAAEELGRAVALQPRDEVLRFLRASAMLAAGDPSGALADADRLESAGFVTVAAELRGRAYLGLNQPDRAAEAFRRGLEADPNASDLRLGLANIYLALHKPREAMDEARRVLAFEPTNVSAQVITGAVFMDAGKDGAAEALLRRAVAAAPRHAYALNNLAWLLSEKRGRPEEALGFAQKAYDISPNQPNIVDTLGWVSHRLGNDDRALSLLQRAVGLDPHAPGARLHLGQVLRLRGHEAEGVRMLEGVAADPMPGEERTEARNLLAPAPAARR